jgi:dienelactone hydrolase
VERLQVAFAGSYNIRYGGTVKLTTKVSIRFLVFGICLAFAGFAAILPARRDVEIAAPDGTRLKGTYYPAAKVGPGVLLLHMCNSDRTAWEPVGLQLSLSGITALALDYRGYGESGGERFDNDPQKQQQIRDNVWPGDIDAALEYLSMQSIVDKNRIGAAGGSCGVNQAVQVARRHAQVKSLVLLAGDTNRGGVNFLQHANWLPIFTAAARDDEFISDAPRSMKWLTELSGNPRNKSVSFNEGKHGTEIFGPHPELPKQIATWFVATLIKSPANLNRRINARKTAASEFWSALNESPPHRATPIFREILQRNSDSYILSQNMFRELGYERLQAGQVKDAIEIFKLWVEAYSKSADAHDSLGDGYLADGQDRQALRESQRALELLPADPVPEPFKTMIRDNISQKLDKLKSIHE